jgi:hypothetical protein
VTYRTKRTVLSARREWLALLVLGLAPLTFSACVDSEVGELAAEAAEEGEATEEAAASFTAADTASRTAAEAIAMSLAMQTPPDSTAPVDTTAAVVKYNAGEDPAFASRYGWPVKGPAPLPGSILPNNRLVCYYGNPNSTRMGALGEYPKDEMLTRLRNQIGLWEAADPETPVKPCLHMVAVVAQGEPGTSGHYRSIMQDSVVNEVYGWAKEANGIFIVDIQVGTDDIRNILPRFEWILKNPDVHLAVDPEFYMRDGVVPGRKIGTMHAEDINYVTDYLAKLVRDNNLPPKVFVVHRFTRGMITNSQNIMLRPEVQVVVHMDGWGAPWLKRDSYRDYVVREPVQYTGFKIFYGNDTKSGEPIMQPADLLKLNPRPVYVQYQ